MRVLGIILAVVILWLGVVQAGPLGGRQERHEYILVKPGETVWNIAARCVTDKEDVRDVIIAIRRLNQLDGNARIYPGQKLKVPVKAVLN